MKTFFFAILILTISLTAISQSSTPATHEHVKEFLDATGSAKAGIQMMNTMLSSFKTQMPDVPAEFWDQFAKEMNPDDLTELVIPIYMKYFSDEDILQLIQFYKSPIGIKMKDTLPMITQESYTAGTEWGKKMAEKVIAELKEKGYSTGN
jgi:uncharacterized protein